MSLATLRKNVCTNIDIGTALKEIAANPHIGDELAFDLLDGRHIEYAVTDINDNAIRFDSVDCLGDDMTYGKVEKWLDRIDHLLPDELQRAIIDTERKHVINGKKMDRLERLFLPAASELFSGDNVLGDKGLYKQIDWYKDRRHRMRMDEHNGDSTAYWTSSQRSGSAPAALPASAMWAATALRPPPPPPPRGCPRPSASVSVNRNYPRAPCGRGLCGFPYK